MIASVIVVVVECLDGTNDECGRNLICTDLFSFVFKFI